HRQPAVAGLTTVAGSSMNYPYDAFISYKSEDRAWADRLCARLVARNLKIYQDVQLRGGEAWLPQLQQALESSRHLIVLWSTNATQPAGWVEKEMFHFDYKCRQQDPKQRRMVVVLIDTDRTPTVFSDLHARADLHQAGAHLGDLNSVPSAAWDQLISKLQRDLQDPQEERPVNCAVLASTRAFFESLDFKHEQGLGGALDDVLHRLGLKDTQAAAPYTSFLDRYGAARGDWRPFGADGPSVLQMLDEVETEVNQSLSRAAQTRVRLQAVDEAFWNNDVQEVERIARTFANSHSLVVIDPLSLYDPAVKDRLDQLRDCLRSSGCAVIMLGPFGLGARGAAISGHVRAMARDTYRHFFDPEFPLPAHYSPSAANVSDLSQIKRYLLLALGRSHLPQSDGDRNPYMGH
ncbi:MAG: toll/interleukin-1 receptor domain-containing protein, partial [Burkholderiaceae bacterium]